MLSAEASAQAGAGLAGRGGRAAPRAAGSGPEECAFVKDGQTRNIG